MLVNSTDMQNSFGKYLVLAAKEDIIITKNCRKTAVLKSYEDESNLETYFVKESAPAYNY
ncbi:MAG TPA: type II toxin-antitoxin system prevent-host-death family antitoxin, partial [Patescibacteria group bacterium]|nr:type II toxin-antitoxin system prevent-host-death family antitoxin [Patescibacteria group bacterium]